MYKNILVPLDGSELAAEKIAEATKLARVCGAKITLIQVAEITPVLKRDKEIESKALKERATEYLDQLVKMIEKKDVPAALAIEEGKPYLEILAFAERNDVDLIIMSTHGLGGFGRLTIGSVSEQVVMNSAVSVLLLKSRSRDLLRGKTILAVDDEPDVLDVLEEHLDMCEVHKTTSYETAIEYIRKHDYDIAILDIMGVSGFDLLKETVAKGIPSVMFTAHAMNADTLRQSLKGGAVFYLPKDKITDVEEILAEVVNSKGKPIWAKVLGRFAPYFNKRFGWSQEDEDRFMKKVLDEE